MNLFCTFFKKINYLSLLIILLLTILVYFASCKSLNVYTVTEEKQLTIIYTQKLQGIYLRKNDNRQVYGGLLSSYFKKMRKEYKNVILVDVGNFVPKLNYSRYMNVQLIFDILSKLTYDAVLLGVMEYEEGIYFLKQIKNNNELAVLSQNIIINGNKQVQNAVKKYTIKKINGVNVGIIGIIGGGLDTSGTNNNEIEILEVNKNNQLSKLIKELKPKVDLIVVLSNNENIKNINFIKSISGIDVMIGGWHNDIQKPLKIKNAIYVNSGEQHIAVLNLKIKDKKIINYKNDLILIDNLKDEDKNFSHELKKIIKNIQYHKEKIIGEILEDIIIDKDVINNNPDKIGILFTNAIKTMLSQNIDVIFINSGAFQCGSKIKKGLIRADDIYTALQFKNKIIISELKGEAIKSILERSVSFPLRNEPQMLSFLQSSGIDYTVDFSKPKQILSKDKKRIIKEGSRISSIKINNKPIQMNKYYKIATNDYVFYEGDGYVQFRNAKNVININTYVQDVVIEYIEKNSPVSIKTKDKIIFLNRGPDNYVHY